MNDLQVMGCITKLLLHPATKRIAGLISILPTMVIFLIETYDCFYPSFELLDFSDKLWIWHSYGQLFSFLVFVLPSLVGVSQSFVKYARLLKYQPIPPAEKPTYTEKDVTVIMPIDDSLQKDPQSLRRRINTILDTPISRLILVFDFSQAKQATRFYALFDDRRILAIPAPECTSLEHFYRAAKVHTDIVILVDEHVSWPTNIVPWLLAPFEDPMMSAVGTLEHVTKLLDSNRDEKYWNNKIMEWQDQKNKDIIFAHTTGDEKGLAEISVRGRTCVMKTKLMAELGFPPWKKMTSDGPVFRPGENGKWYIQYGPECFVHASPDNTELGYHRWILSAPPE